MNPLQQFIHSKPLGFITTSDLPKLIALDRLCPVLVRCGCVRFTCGAQYLPTMLAHVEAGGDYVRDVSFPVGSLERAAAWVADCPVVPVATLPASFTAPRGTFPTRTHRGSYLCDEDSHSDADPGL